MKVAAANILDQVPVEGVRLVVFADEHEEVQLPDGLLMADGKVELYDEVLAKGLFKIIVKGRKLVLHAGSFVGLIPINDRLAVEVRTRVPVANLERMLNMVSKVEAQALSVRTNYALASELPTSVLDLVADDFLAAIGALRTEGLPRGYELVRQTGTQISGTILVRETTIQRARTGRFEASYRNFQRSLNTPANRLLRDAVVLLIALYEANKNRVGNRKRLTLLSGALNFFDFVPQSAGPLLRRPVNPDSCANNRPQLYRAVRLANLVVQSQGISIRQRGAEDLPTFLVNMEHLFEDYVRIVIRSALAGQNGTRVLDGNQPRPDGGKSVLFAPATVGTLGNKPVTPDTLIEVDGVCRVVIETKYKPCKDLPSREELSQVMAYGAAYNCTNLVLAYPSLAGETGLKFLGESAGLKFFKATIDMGSPFIEAAEDAFAEMVGHLLV